MADHMPWCCTGRSCPSWTGRARSVLLAPGSNHPWAPAGSSTFPAVGRV
ncbi:hypothetical protein SXCC_03228 [Gluconacetobacter sp. SXCC-1]|nr:hypothetical protein SXCC_03228 [Gluconacetobacter sp. SXCC-1]